MILVAAVLLLAALGMLAAGLAQGSAALQWGSFAASALAAIVLAVGELRRRRQTSQDDDESAAVPAEVGARAEAGPAPRTVATGGGSPAMTAPAPDRPDQLPPPAAPAEEAPSAEPAEIAPVPAAVAPPVSAHAAPEEPPATGAHSAAPVLDGDGEPPVEEVEVTDLLLVLDLTDEVLVVDEHPRYHLADCPHLADVATIPMPMDEARTDGFTPCGTCAPDRNLAHRERARRAG